MSIVFKADKRELKGTGASRRLRRAGKLPGIIYGGEQDPVQVEFDHNELYHLLRKEAFHASVLTIDINGGPKESVVLRDTQWHPFRQQVLHLDFQRVDATHKVHIKVPLHFINGDVAPGVKTGGGIVSHILNELDVQCLPSNLPEFIEVDLKSLEAGQSIHVSQIPLPAGVTAVAHGSDDPVVVSIVLPRGAVSDAAAEEEPKK